MRLLSTVVVVILSHIAAAYGQTNQELRAELLAMRALDQKARDECSGNADEQLKCYMKMSEDVDKPNTKRINEIYNAGGFPTVKLVGRDGVDAFFLLLQHSNDTALKQKCLPSIERAFREKVMSANNYSNFTDRLLVA